MYLLNVPGSFFTQNINFRFQPAFRVAIMCGQWNYENEVSIIDVAVNHCNSMQTMLSTLILTIDKMITASVGVVVVCSGNAGCLWSLG